MLDQLLVLSSLSSRSVAEVLPPQVPFVVTIQTNDRFWQPIKQLSPVNLNDITDNFVTMPRGLSFRKDVLPFLQDQVGVSLVNEQVVVILPLKNQPAINKMIDRVDQTLRPAQQETYKGVVIRSWPATQDYQNQKQVSYYPLSRRGIDPFQVQGGRAAVATLPGYLLFSDRSEALKQMIDFRLAKNNLASSVKWQRMTNNPEWQSSIVSMYGDYDRFTELFQKSIAQIPDDQFLPGLSKNDLTKALEVSLTNYDTFSSYLEVKLGRIRSRGIAYFNVSPNDPVPGQTANFSRQITPNSYFVALSHDLNRQWQWFQNYTNQIPLYKGILTVIKASTLSSTGLDIDSDILPWMDGNYGIVLFPADRGLLPEVAGVNLGLGVLLQTSKRQQANAAMKKFEQFARSALGERLTTTPALVNGIRVTKWELDGKDFFAYGWQNADTLVLATGSAQIPAISNSPRFSLAQSSIYRSAVPNEQNLHTIVFFNLRQSLKPLLAFTPQELKNPSLLEAAQSLKSVSITYQFTPDRLEGEFILEFGKN